MDLRKYEAVIVIKDSESSVAGLANLTQIFETNQAKSLVMSKQEVKPLFHAKKKQKKGMFCFLNFYLKPSAVHTLNTTLKRHADVLSTFIILSPK